LLQAIEISQGYGRKEVFADLSFTFGPGIHGILGPNGAGKTTLLTTLATLRAPRTGEVRLHDVPVSEGKSLQAARRRISFLPQGFNYPSSFTVMDFLAYSAWVREVPTRLARARAPEVVRQLDLEGVAQMRLRKLSGGTLQRAGIAQALMADPAVLILDEPTAGLDPAQRLSLRQLLLTMADKRCVLLSTHLVEDVMQICDHVDVLAAGSLAFSGSPQLLAERGSDGQPGVSKAEAGYLAVMDATVLHQSPQVH
jgi:ABC-2 type transport system ATP-binding protein